MKPFCICRCNIILKPVLELYASFLSHSIFQVWLLSNCAELYKTMLSVENYILHG